MKNKVMVSLTLILLFAGLFLTACRTDANIASENLSKNADMFQIYRRVVFYNGITDEYILTVEGLCSINVDGSDRQLELMCKTGKNEFKKHFLGLSDNVTYFVEQLESAPADVYHYKVIFKPEAVIPDIDLSTSITDGEQ